MLKLAARLLLTASLALPLVLAAGCGEGDEPGGGAPGGGASGKADNPTAVNGTRLTLIQGGVFYESLGQATYVPRLVHYGFVDKRGAEWQDVADVPVAYDQDHLNLPVEVVVPEQHRQRLLAWVVYSEAAYVNGVVSRRRWSRDQFVDLAREAEGTVVRLPVGGGAGYPFGGDCYGINVRNETEDGKVTRFGGLATGAYFGFTTATLDDYRQNNDVPWQNASGELTAEGHLPLVHEHDGGYKGTYFMLPEFVRVPRGQNLVFKLTLDKFSGVCGISSDTRFEGSAETQTYFLEVQHP